MKEAGSLVLFMALAAAGMILLYVATPMAVAGLHLIANTTAGR